MSIASVSLIAIIVRIYQGNAFPEEYQDMMVVLTMSILMMVLIGLRLKI